VMLCGAAIKPNFYSALWGPTKVGP
jgi:hypothetical protein